MPVKAYPITDNQEVVTAQLRRYSSGNCVTTGSSTIIDTTSFVKRWDYSRASGWETPGWRRMRNEGILLPMTPWTKYTSSFEAQQGSREWCANSSAQRQKWENYYLSATPSVTDITEGYLLGKVDPYDLQYYVQKAAAAIYSRGWDALTFISEIGQLRRMISGIGEKLRNLSQGRKPGELSDLWLEGRYGWRTLMYDIRDLHEVLSQVNERRTRHREQKGYSTSGSWSAYQDVTSSGFTSRRSVDISWQINLRGVVVADIEVPDFQFNPVTTAWEVTRLSFVVDWLLNVGQALEAASFLLMAKSHKACGGVKIDFDVNCAASLLSVTAPTIVHSYGGSWGGHASYVERVPLSVSAMPRMKLRLDGFKVIDLLALVAQRLR